MPYPIYLDIEDRACLVAGAGSVGLRKIQGLLEARARHILVVDPGLKDILARADERGRALLADSSVSAYARPFEEADLGGVFLAFAATSDKAVNEAIALACKKRGILCNVATSRALSTFLVPSRVEANGILAAVMTDGKSPALSRRLRREIGDLLERDFPGIAEFMTRLRPLVLAQGWPHTRNSDIFRSFAESGLNIALARQDGHDAHSILSRLLPDELHPHIEDLLHGLV